MFTSTNLKFLTTGSTPASTGPMHAGGTHSVNLKWPTTSKREKGFQQAIQECLQKLPEDDKAAFQSAPNIIDRLHEMQRSGKPLVSSSLTSRVEKVLQCVENFMNSLGILTQDSLLVVGGVNCVFTVCTSGIYSSCNLD